MNTRNWMLSLLAFASALIYIIYISKHLLPEVSLLSLNLTLKTILPTDSLKMVENELQYSRNEINKFDKELGLLKPGIIDQKRLTTIDTSSRDYFEKIKSLENLRTVFFHISKTTMANTFGPRIFAVHSNNCTLLITKAIIDKDVIDHNCTQEPTYFYVNMKSNASFPFRSIYNLQKGFFDLNKKPPYKLVNESREIDIGFMHLVRNAYLMENGDIITEKYYISITRCHKVNHPHFKQTSEIYEKVFSISQFWGGGYYHFTNEDLPRIVFALPFLLENKDIKVHVSSRNSFVRALLDDLGITENRLISGNVHARTAFVPGGSSCGQAPMIPINILSSLLRSKLKKEHKRDTIVLIKRSAKRWFENHTQILSMLKSSAEKFNLRVEVFADRPPPTIKETRKMFNRAIMVVAPHGAGLSNILFSQPGTCVVEGLCYEGGKVNHCYKHLAQVLGHIYHGVVPSTQCMHTKPENLQPSVHQCLRWTLNNPSSK